MKQQSRRRIGALTLLFLLIAGAAVRADFQPEAIGRVATLPEQYPGHWMMVHDAAFFHMFEGEVLIVDPLAATAAQQLKGMLTASFIADYKRSRTRNEHYVMETFYSRGTRGGDRTDVVTIWDPATLEVSAEIEIPAKRISGMPKTISSGMTPDEKFLLIYNFTPSQSVSVVNLETREFVGEVPTPGCGFIVPTGARGFTSICANGSMRTSVLNDDGSLSNSETSGVLFDAEADPIFEGAAISGGVAYFPTFSGRVLPVDVSGPSIEVGDTWWLSEADERNWRPGGMRPSLADSEGLGYFLMNPEGAEGTHKDGGSEVWVFDLAAGRRIGRIVLENWGISIGTSGAGDNRLLAVTNADLGVDIYRIPDGDFVHALSIEPQTPFLVHGAE